MGDKIFVECSFIFYDEHLAPVMQRKARSRIAYFRRDTDKYVLDCHFNTEDPLMQRDHKLDERLSLGITIGIIRATPADKKTPRIFSMVAIPPFRAMPASTSGGSFEVAATFNTFADIKRMSAIFHYTTIKRDHYAEGVSIEVSVAEMREFLGNVDEYIAQTSAVRASK